MGQGKFTRRLIAFLLRQKEQCTWKIRSNVDTYLSSHFRMGKDQGIWKAFFQRGKAKLILGPTIFLHLFFFFAFLRPIFFFRVLSVFYVAFYEKGIEGTSLNRERNIHVHGTFANRHVNLVLGGKTWVYIPWASHGAKTSTSTVPSRSSKASSSPGRPICRADARLVGPLGQNLDLPTPEQRIIKGLSCFHRLLVGKFDVSEAFRIAIKFVA